ncbi:thioether cross-link-forming SCIFF peptide maturase [Geosporobacter ferrireducens]|uniref:Thioether cross-link-forming SCIFF peptide maturase n=1 Tax=Geosporobacter ferrireducens TaxID=1424294 RepID=A0A1D8GPD6_9FIRM|nr:thioether cross-link-forming SCIFF peptide maturase [Geosporobacter ferrireducens]AOT72820.1 thioether cross-link-forming SCIFF peptide maturase [Geosporobacter ferrireducens]MTI55219.1 thioether cross-link-forming SCIFF peptide maturase [Geosporobacter ferrireducens]
MIHKFEMDGTRILIDVNSGAVHIIDEIVYNLLDFYQKEDKDTLLQIFKNQYEQQEIIDALDEIKALETAGLLFTQDSYEAHPSFQNRRPVVKALCLHIAHDCNISCKYCFASQGDFKGTRSLMNETVGMKAIDFLIEHSGNRRNLEIDFFGGEPLMNLEVVKRIVDYGRSKEQSANKRFRFTLTTNGILLNEENMAYINEHMENVVLSIDGRKEVNDNMRKTLKGDGTYDIILPKLQKMAEMRKNKNYYVRGTFTREHLDFAKDVLHLAELGFQNTSVEPVVTEADKPYAIRHEDLPEIFRQYEILAKEYVERKKNNRGFNFFHFMIDLNQGPCVIKRVSGCGAGSEYLAITPEGDIYPCHQFVGNEHFKMGNILDEQFNREVQTEFGNAHIYNKPQCRECWAKFYCSGGCHANAYNFYQDVNRPYEIGCEMEKKRIECALMIQAKLLSEEDN